MDLIKKKNLMMHSAEVSKTVHIKNLKYLHPKIQDLDFAQDLP